MRSSDAVGKATRGSWRANSVTRWRCSLWTAAVLAWVAGIVAIAIVIVIVVLILINAAFAYAQELQAERAVEALAAYLPAQATVIRDGQVQPIPSSELVPGDVLVIEEGDRISADARLFSGPRGRHVDPHRRVDGG